MGLIQGQNLEEIETSWSWGRANVKLTSEEAHPKAHGGLGRLAEGRRQGL